MSMHVGPGDEPNGGPFGHRTHPGCAVIGVGASAGGLKAFRLLLSTLPADTGFAIVFIQHLDPTHHSSLSEILGRSTRMPVEEATDGAPVEPNHVYVIPPNTTLTIAHRVLHLTPRSQMAQSHMPIDHFFRSLAQDCRSSAIGVILSGAGSDGSLGLQAVKEAGGVTFAQEPESAEYSSMPHMAELASGVDFILPPEKIAAELARIARHPHFTVLQDGPQELPPVEPGAGLQEILAVMHEATGIDFSLYRERTVQRRITRRLALANITSVAEYVRLLKKDSGERTLLQRDLLISVTNFFRDPGSFHALATHVFPAIVQNRPPGEPIRIWVAGCASGEEAYSLAISVQEYLKKTDAAFPVQIFATDLSEAAIHKARSAKYLDIISADVSPERLNRYFTRIEGCYQVSKALRELCVFSRHNLIEDPAFAKLDLISCRNVLIYLGSIQRNIIPMFHYALKPQGFLMLGRTERPGFDDLFSMVDPDHKIFQKKEAARSSHRIHPRTAWLRRSVEGGKMAPVPELWDGVEVGKAVDHLLLSKYSPAAVLVDESLHVLEVRGDPTPFFRLPVGKVTFHLLKLIPDTGLYLEIEKLVHVVEQSGQSERRAGVPYEFGGQILQVNVEVTPLRADQRRALLILLEPAREGKDVGEAREGAPEHPQAGSNVHRDREMLKLKQDAAETRRRLLSAMEEHQVADEENQSAAEEALSANEELQSLNEELETAKEELQSTNEELITVNQELGLKNSALTESSAFAMSIVETIHVPLLVLDQELRIRTANEWFSKTFLIPQREMVGQFLFSLADGIWDIYGLRDLLNRVLSSGDSFDNFEVKREFPQVGSKHLIVNGRRLPHLHLILIAIDDVTARRSVEGALRESQEALRQAQKMEAIGRLAGGIAHDFNNLLTAIIGYGHLVADALGSGHQAMEHVQEIQHAGERAAALTDQLLAFSRRKVVNFKVFDVNTVVADFEKMLRRIVGEQINVMVRAASDLWRVNADAGEIGRALMNLCLNARDAMPGGGTLTIQTANVFANMFNDEHDPHFPHLMPGPYVELSVRDTGIGMDAETQSRLFEPFFTTKEEGKGTGLGLAAVLGIVKQSGGAISCQSELGEGTRFNILLPAIEAVAEVEERPAGRLAEAPKGLGEVILLVEDEDQVRKLTGRILRDLGYVVLEARDGREGIAACEEHPGKIDLILSDVIMPDLGGRGLADRIQKTRPRVKVLFMSGHAQDLILKEGVHPGIPFLVKPFAPVDLARKVREVLDSENA